MKLGIIENWDENGFAHAQALGLDAVEFCYNIGNDPARLKTLVPDLKKWSKETGVSVGSIGRWGTDKITPAGAIIQEELKGTYALIDVCAKLGCPVFNTGVNYVKEFSWEKNCDLAVEFLAKACDYGAKKGVKVAAYNCNWNNFVVNPRAWIAILPRVPALGIKYDCSHCIQEGSGDYLGEMDLWGEKFYHFHVKGVLYVGNHYVDDPPAGLDQIDWPAVFGMLYARHYDGMLSIEPHSALWRGDLGEWGIRRTIDYVRPMIYPGTSEEK